MAKQKNSPPGFGPHQLKRPKQPQQLLIPILLYFLQLSTANPTQTSTNNLTSLIHTLIHSTTKLLPVKTMYIQYDTISLNHPVPLSQIEATIDSLSIKLSSLRHATTIKIFNLLSLSQITSQSPYSKPFFLSQPHTPSANISTYNLYHSPIF